jgi:hypothetical protein
LQVEYDILTNVLYRHRYFSNQRLECLAVRPALSAETYLLNNGLILKSFKDGFALLYETSNNGQRHDKSEILDNTITLRFYLTLNDNSFYNYTDGQIDNLTETVYYFHNLNENEESMFAANRLHHDEFVSQSDVSFLASLGEITNNKTFAVIDIRLKEELPVEYFIYFKEIQTYWRYVLVSDYLQNLHQPAILGEKEFFDGPNKIELPNKQDALCFISSEPISHIQIPLNRFKLVENYTKESSSYRVVKRMLPSPDPSSISNIGGIREIDKKYSDIFIY